MNKNKLAAAIVAKGMKQKDVAKLLNMAPKTFYLKMKKGVFGTDEVAAMVKILDIKDPVEIFLAN